MEFDYRFDGCSLYSYKDLLTTLIMVTKCLGNTSQYATRDTSYSSLQAEGKSYAQGENLQSCPGMETKLVHKASNFLSPKQQNRLG